MKSRIAADFLVSSLLKEETSTVLVKDSSGNIKNQFAVPNPQDLGQIEKFIDDNGGIPFGGSEEDEHVRRVAPDSNLRALRRWTNLKQFSTIREQIVEILTRAIHEEPIELFKTFASISDLSKLSAMDNRYPQEFMKGLANIKMSPKQRSKSTGEGEIAIAFLCGKAPAQQADYDLLQGGIEYSIKSNMEDIRVYRQDIPSDLKSDSEFRSLSPAMQAVKVLGLNTRGNTERTRRASKRYAVVCRSTDTAFEFKVFSLSDRVNAQLAFGGDVPGTNRQIWTNKQDLLIRESKNDQAFISELSRRDKQDVEAIARRVAQEVLEDELGDDFDKAVRREMVASFKDGEVEDGIADISKEYMRKFYRSLGVGTSPLDKVKI